MVYLRVVNNINQNSIIMSEQIIPDVELTSDVAVAEPVTIEEPAVNYSELTLAELVKLFEELVQNEERMKMSKESRNWG